MAKEEYEPSKEELAEEIRSLRGDSIDYVSPSEFKSAKQKGLRRAISRLEVSTRAKRRQIASEAKPTTFALGKALSKGVSDFLESIPPEGMSKAQWKRELARRKRKAKKSKGR